MDFIFILLIVILGLGLLFLGGIIFFSKAIYQNVFKRRYDDDDTFKFFSVEEFKYLTCEEVKFLSEGLQLQGYWYKNHLMEQKAIVVFAHGLGPGQMQYMTEINWLCDNGFLVFAFDIRGCAKSEGKKLGGFKNAAIDLENAINFVRKTKDLPILLFGHSMGGYAVNNVLPNVNFVKGAVSVSSPNSFKGIIYDLFSHTFKPIARLIAFFVGIKENKNGVKYKKTNSINSLVRTKIPVLFITGDKDNVVNIQNHHFMFKDVLKYDNSKVFLEVEDRYHRPLLTTEGALYSEEVNNLIAKTKKLYKGHMPDKVKRELYNSLDYDKMVEMDKEVLNKIAQFYKNCLK